MSARGRLPPSPGRRPQRGFALVIVLWVAALLGLIGASHAFNMRLESRLSANLVDRARAGALADAGINRAIIGLSLPEAAERWRPGAGAYAFRLGAGTVRVRVSAENGKVDLNAAPEALIRGLIETVSGSLPAFGAARGESVAHAILDWRDADDRRRPRGAEAADYRAAGFAYTARNEPFLVVSELNQVMGVDHTLFDALHDFVTVYSGTAQIDPMSAPKEVLQSVPGLEDADIERFIADRAGRGDAAGDEARRGSMDRLSAGRRYLGRGRAPIYTLSAEAELDNGVIVTRQAVVRLAAADNRPYSILDWRERGGLSRRTPE